jgi:hypothetical protein
MKQQTMAARILKQTMATRILKRTFFLCSLFLLSLPFHSLSLVLRPDGERGDGKNCLSKNFVEAFRPESLQSRKKFLHVAASTALLPASNILTPYAAFAAAPITTKETDSLGVMARRALRPKPPKILRRKLSMDFAVLLMRSSYSALDRLDCVAMVR